MTTSKIVTDNDAKNEEMRFLRFVSVHLNPLEYMSGGEYHGLFNIHALNSSAPFTASTDSQMGYLF